MELKSLLEEVEMDSDKVLKDLSRTINEMQKLQFIVCYHHIYLYLKESIENHAEKQFSLNISLREDGYGHYLYCRIFEGDDEYEYTSSSVTEDFANGIFDAIDKIYVTNLNFFGSIKEEGEVYLDFGKSLEVRLEKYILSEDCQSTYRAALLEGKLRTKKDLSQKIAKI